MMQKTNFNDLLKSINKKTFLPVYLLYGTEPYFLEQTVEKFLEKAIPPHEKSFNEFILFGKDCSVGTIISTARKFPMMAEHQLVLIKDAEQIEDLSKKEAQTLLEDYFLKPIASTILVLVFNSNLDERKSWVKTALTHGTIFQSKSLYDNELPDFVLKYCRDNGLSIVQNAVLLLVEHIGNDLKRIAKELKKISVNISIDQPITEDTVSTFVGISKEFNVFELQKAMASRDLAKTFQIIQFFASNTKQYPIQATLIMLYNFFSKALVVKMNSQMPDSDLAKAIGVNSYFLKDYKLVAKNFQLIQLLYIIKALRLVDAKSKGIGGTNETEQGLYNELMINVLK